MGGTWEYSRGNSRSACCDLLQGIVRQLASFRSRRIRGRHSACARRAGPSRDRSCRRPAVARRTWWLRRSKWAATPTPTGSSEPVCPALRALNMRLTRATAPAELKPTGLSSNRMPWMSAGISFLNPRRSRGPHRASPRRVRPLPSRLGRPVDRIDQLRQTHAVLDGGVELEAQSRRVANHQRTRQCVAQKAGRALQTPLHLGIGSILAEHQVVTPAPCANRR